MDKMEQTTGSDRANSILEPGSPLDPLIVDSWSRCSRRLSRTHLPAKKPLPQDTFLAAQISNFDLISIGIPVMEDIHQYIENTEVALLLINSAGYILEMFGDDSMISLAKEFGITPGMPISEEIIGTNAFSLALTERVPVSVVGSNHFLDYFKPFGGAGSPIFDALGRRIGVLGILTSRHLYHPTMLALIAGGSRTIEAERQSDLLLREQNRSLAELNAILATITEGILVWNTDGILIQANNAATKMLGIETKSILGKSIEADLQLPGIVSDAVIEERPLTNVEIRLRSGSKTIESIANLRFVTAPNRLRWNILTLRPLEEVRHLFQQQAGVQLSVSIDDFIGESNPMRKLRRLAKTVAPARASVLIRGEIGTGKDYLARAIHISSPQKDMPFVIFNCASAPSELIVAELLGQEGDQNLPQRAGRPSKFELARDGTLFLQHIESLPLEAQAVLLGVLEIGIVHRLGSSYPIEISVRVIASTSADLQDLVAQGNFRADLYYRLSPFEIVIPSLQEHITDLPIYVDRIIARLSRTHERSLSLAPGMLEILRRYSWPGNLRELEAILERGAIQAGVSEMIGPMHLPDYVRYPLKASPIPSTSQHVPTLAELEREAIIQTARICNGNVTRMARVLGVGRTTIWRKMKDLNFTPDQFRPGSDMHRSVSE
jgi:transcriptional regulator of acetoin/glycerol metabolism